MSKSHEPSKVDQRGRYHLAPLPPDLKLSIHLSPRLTLEHLEHELNVREQYRQQVQLLNDAGLIRSLETGTIGFRDINGKPHPTLSLEEVYQRLGQHPHILEKMTNGFRRLLLVPFGLDVDTFLQCYGTALKQKAVIGGLVSAGQRLELDRNEPVYLDNRFRQNDLVYYPKQYDRFNHGGYTKQELLDTESSAWHIILTENTANIPKPPVELSPQQHLDLLQENSGLTIEDQVVLALTYLHHGGKVIDDYAGSGLESYLLGSYVPAYNRVIIAYWNRGRKQAGFDGHHPDDHKPDAGARISIRV